MYIHICTHIIGIDNSEVTEVHRSGALQIAAKPGRQGSIIYIYIYVTYVYIDISHITYNYMYMHIYIYIYIHRERDRERERDFKDMVLNPNPEALDPKT